MSLNAVETWKALRNAIEAAERSRPVMRNGTGKAKDEAIIAYSRAVDEAHKRLIELRDMGVLDDFEQFLDVTFGGA